MYSIIKHFKKVVTLAAMSVLPLCLSAQTPAEQAEEIRQNRNTYIYGEGFADSYRGAVREAETDLLSKISVYVESHNEMEMEEKQINGNIDSKTAFNTVIKSHAQGALKNTKSITIASDPEYHEFRYIRISDVKKIFEERKDLIRDWVGTAAKCEKQYKIDDALRYYYWSLVMLKSLQYPNELLHDGDDRPMITWIPEQIDAILKGIDTRIVGIKDNIVDLRITYKEKPIAGLDFTYYDGIQWSGLTGAKNGVSSIELRPNSILQNIQLKYEYEYESDAHINKDLETVMSVFKGTNFRSALINLNKNDAPIKVDKQARKEFQADLSTGSAAEAVEAKKDTKQYLPVIQAVEKAIQAKAYDSVRQYFTDEGWDMFDKLIGYGEARIVGDPTLQFYEMGEYVVCRSLPMMFSFPSNNRKFMEDITFTFNGEGKIDCLAFSLGTIATNDIFTKNVGTPDEVKMTIATFLENYKTAFALKRLDYINDIFDDNAVIITGHVVKKPEANKPLEQNQKRIVNGGEMVEYTKMDKKQYLKKLESCFRSNQFINIKFSDNDVTQMLTDENTFGIQIHQDYFSSSYGDTGYLYLQVDFNDKDNPTIRIRTWQPHRDPSVNSNLPRNHPDWGIIGPGNF